MRDQYLLAIDIGTGSARAVSFTRTGQQVGMGQREYGLRENRRPGRPRVTGVRHDNELVAGGAMRAGGARQCRYRA